MFAFLMALSMVAAADPALQASQKDKPTVHCREMGSASSRSEAIVVCRTKAQWQVRDACQGATRYCSKEDRLAMMSELPGRETTFPAGEESRIVCRKLAITGSRLRSTTTCMANREWQRMYDDTQVEMKELQNSFSKKGPF